MNYDDPNGHLLFQRFGLTNIEQESQVDAMLAELPAVRPTTAELLTLAAYQTDYGIYDHERLKGVKPLALVRMHDKENIVEGGLLYSHIRRYHVSRIYKHFGLNLTDFLALPLHVVDLLYDIAQSESVKSDADARELQRELNDQFDE